MIWHVLSLEMCTYTDKSIPIGQLNSNKHYIILYTYSMNGLLCNIIINAYIRFFVFFHFSTYIHVCMHIYRVTTSTVYTIWAWQCRTTDKIQRTNGNWYWPHHYVLLLWWVWWMVFIFEWNTAADFIRAHHENGQSFTDREKWFKINFDNAKEI